MMIHRGMPNVTSGKEVIANLVNDVARLAENARLESTEAWFNFFNASDVQKEVS